jgi:DNA-binding beta-propeller fold protein YncE
MKHRLTNSYRLEISRASCCSAVTGNTCTWQTSETARCRSLILKRITSCLRLIVGNGPIALTLNENNTLLFVANYCDKTISVVDLTTSPPNISPISTGDGGNPIDMVAFTENNNEYTRLYVAKEYYPQRPLCGDSGRPNLDVAVFSFQNPKTSVL